MHKRFEWDKQKNRKLLKERGISFEAIVANIEAGNVVDITTGTGKFSHQKQYIMEVNKYIYIVLFIEDADKIFMKTIIPSRKMTRKYLVGEQLR